MSELTHLDEEGNVHMVNVGSKASTDRLAIATAVVTMADATADLLFSGGLPKGDGIATVRVAAIQGAKRTADLIPLCHPLPIDRIDVDVARVDTGVEIRVTVGVHARTGVEMEAMTGAGIGALTLYDMIKGVDRSAFVAEIALVSKSGGRSGEWRRG